MDLKNDIENTLKDIENTTEVPVLACLKIEGSSKIEGS